MGLRVEAGERLLDALAQRGPLLVRLEGLQWGDRASLDRLRYLGRSWREHGSRVLLLAIVRREELEFNLPLAAELADLGRHLPLSQVSLQALSQQEAIHLVQALVGQGAPGTQRAGERGEHGPALPSRPGAAPVPERELPLVALGEVLFAQTGGQPLYLLETLKLWQDRQTLVPPPGAGGGLRVWPPVGPGAPRPAGPPPA